jgi:hypothetical protein
MRLIAAHHPQSAAPAIVLSFSLKRAYARDLPEAPPASGIGIFGSTIARLTRKP